MRIFREFTFEAAHRLPNLPPEHRCYNLHGHNYRVRIECTGPVDPMLGWVADFAFIDGIAEMVKSHVDHKYLNEVKGLENPTAEIIAMWILELARLTILEVSGVTVWENETCGAIAE